MAKMPITDNVKTIKAAIFDLDGTMVDNMMTHHEAWQKKLLECGLTLTIEEVKESVHGINEEILERLFGSKYTPEERKQLSREKEETYRNHFASKLTLVPGLIYFIKTLEEQNIDLAIASAAPTENVDFVVDGLNIRHHFSYILHSEHVSKGKPDPEIYIKAAKLLKQKTEDCIVFEDSPTGAKAASAAGCPIVIVTTTHTPEEFKNIKGIINFINNFEGFVLNR